MSRAPQKSRSAVRLKASTQSLFADPAAVLKRSNAAWSFSQSQRFHAELSATVNVPLSPAKGTLSSAGASLRCGNRPYHKPMLTPGPDAYNPRLSSTRSCSFGKSIHGTAFLRAAFRASKHVPGPGAYSVARQLASKHRAIAFKGNRRELDPFAGQPGPGHYNPQKQAVERRLAHGVSFGSGGRSDFTKSERGPGPGTYEIRSRFR